MSKAMNKQKAIRAIDTALKALEAIEVALKENNHRRVGAEIWSVRQQLLALNAMFDHEKVEEQC